jgi:maltose-binding protein MalE
MYPDPYHLFPLMTAYGGGVFGVDEDGSYDPTQVMIDSEGSIEAARVLESMVEAGYVGPDVDYNTAQTLFREGDAAFLMTGPWEVTNLNDSGIPYAISPIPAGTQPGQPFLGAQGFMVSNFSEELPLAESFLVEYVATEDVMRELAVSRNSASAYAPVLEEQIAEGGTLAGFAEAGQNAVPMPAIPEMAAVWTAWGDAETLIIQQQEDAQTAFEQAAEQIRAAIEALE